MAHLIIDITECHTNGRLEECVQKLARVATKLELNVVNACSHQFEPQGATHILLLAESHLSIHTFPEQNRVALDLYCCSNIDTIKALDVIQNEFPGEYKIRIIKR